MFLTVVQALRVGTSIDLDITGSTFGAEGTSQLGTGVKIWVGNQQTNHTAQWLTLRERQNISANGASTYPITVEALATSPLMRLLMALMWAGRQQPWALRVPRASAPLPSTHRAQQSRMAAPVSVHW